MYDYKVIVSYGYKVIVLEGALGFEPRPGGSKPHVLPLHHTPMAAAHGFEPRPPESESGVLPLN